MARVAIALVFLVSAVHAVPLKEQASHHKNETSSPIHHDHDVRTKSRNTTVSSRQSSSQHHIHRDVFVVNATAAEHVNASSSVPQGRSIENNVAPRQFLLDFVKPVAGVLNGDFGTGLVAPTIPGFHYKDDDLLNPSAAIAAAYSPLEPLVAPFRPAAMFYTGATPADISNLHPNKDLVYPFLDPPKNEKLHKKDKNDLRSAPETQEATMTPEMVAIYKTALEQWKRSQMQAALQQRINMAAAGNRDFGFGIDGLGLGLSPLGIGPLGPLGGPLGVAGASVPLNPLVSPFYPFAQAITGATAADLNNLRPEADLVKPFLNPPFNSKPDGDKNGGGGFLGLAGLFRGAPAPAPGAVPAPVPPQQVSKLIKTLASKNHNGTVATRSNDAHEDKNSTAHQQQHAKAAAARVLPFAGAVPFGAAGPLPGLNLLDKNTLLALSPLSDGIAGFNPIHDFVLPFLPADKNPLLSLLYYITPYPLRTGQRMAAADKMIAASVAARSDMTPAEAVARARDLQGVVAAAEIHHTLKSLGLGDVSAALLRTFSRYLPADVAQSRDALLLSSTGHVRRDGPFEALGDFFGDVLDGGKGDDEKLGKIPGAAPILHYFYPYLPKKVLKPFKPLVDSRDGLFDDVGDFFGGFFDGNGGGKKKDDDVEKLGNIPGAAAILHYFYPYLPKRVLKPFKPLVDVKAAVERMAATRAVIAEAVERAVARRAAFENAVNQRLFEVKFAAAAEAMKRARYQRRIMDAVEAVSRGGRQFFDADFDADLADEHPTDMDAEAAAAEAEAEDASLGKASSDDDADAGADDGEGHSEVDDSSSDSGSDDTNIFAGQHKNPIAQIFRFLIPELSIEDEEITAAHNAVNGGQSLLEARELRPEAGLPAALDFIDTAVRENAPFPLNDIYRWWTEFRGFNPMPSPQGRSLHEAADRRPAFNESFASLRRKQVATLKLNDSFVRELHAECNTSTETGSRQGRQLGGGLAGLLPFPFNLLASFVPGLRSSGSASAASSSSSDEDGGSSSSSDVPSSLDDEYSSAFEESGVSAQEGDRRMAAMIGPFVPEPLNQLVGLVMPFRSLEQDFGSEAVVDDGSAEKEHDSAMKQFQESLRAIREQYAAKQDEQAAKKGRSVRS